MALYARVEDDVVVELIETGGFMISQLFAADFLSSMIAVPEGVEVEVGKPIPLPEQVAPLSPWWTWRRQWCLVPKCGARRLTRMLQARSATGVNRCYRPANGW